VRSRPLIFNPQPSIVDIGYKNRLLTLIQEEGYEVVAFLAAVGQEEDWEAVELKALKIGAQKMVIEGE
jgi:hypothetical protein